MIKGVPVLGTNTSFLSVVEFAGEATLVRLAPTGAGFSPVYTCMYICIGKFKLSLKRRRAVKFALKHLHITEKNSVLKCSHDYYVIVHMIIIIKKFCPKIFTWLLYNCSHDYYIICIETSSHNGKKILSRNRRAQTSQYVVIAILGKLTHFHSISIQQLWKCVNWLRLQWLA